MQHTAEFVTPKHPDKICDRISDAILDACLEQDPYSRTGIETLGGHKKVFITGEITTKATVDYPAVAHTILGPNGYDIVTNIVQQSPEIAGGVDTGGAGDQGIMVGYACDENEEYMPHEYYLARKLCRDLYQHAQVDGKTQVTTKNGQVETVVASFQGIKIKDLEKLVKQYIKAKNYYVNPAGEWIDLGGFDADAGATGRKIVVDAYGPRVPVGGGAFSGKDPTKVDRSAAYMARRIALDYLEKHQAKEVLVKIAYAIGVNKDLMATALIDGKPHLVKEYDLSPKAIIDFLKLRRPQYETLAQWGHFGRKYSWDA